MIRKISTLILVLLSFVFIYGDFHGFWINYPIHGEELTSKDGHAYSIKVEPPVASIFKIKSDGIGHARQSQARLFENDILMDKAHSIHADIRKYGMGRFSQWGHYLIFSSTDNSDPRENGNKYRIEIRLFVKHAIAVFMVVFLLVCANHIYRKKYGSGDMAWTSYTLLWSAAIYSLAVILRNTHGVLFYCVAGLLLVSLIWGAVFGAHTLRLILHNFASPIERVILKIKGFVQLRPVNPSGKPIAKTATLLVVSLTFIFALAEASVDLLGRIVEQSVQQQSARSQAVSAQKVEPLSIRLSQEAEEKIKYRAQFVTMPKLWGKEIIKVPGSIHSVRWQNVVHVLNQDYFRRTTPFPPKSQKKLRIIAVGDSYTYGWGIEKKFGYPALLQNKLIEEYNVEVLNLGNNGAQSEGILKVLKKQIPILDPDLVIYDVTLNDFLPSGVGQEALTAPTVSEKIFKRLKNHSDLIKFISDRWHVLLIRMGYTDDFYGQLLRYIDDYAPRFGDDVKQMNSYVMGKGLPPIIAMVLDQSPRLNGPGYRLAQIADKKLKEAGVNLIPSDDFYKKYNGKSFVVSRWEGHPNEEANAIFASRFYDKVIHLGILQKYKKH